MLSIKTLDFRYHQAIFQFLDIDPIIDPQAEQIIAIREKACQMKFPASVKEWFSIKGVGELFHRHTNSDHLVDIYELGHTEQIDYGYLCVAIENQAVVLWFALLNGSDNPPIFHDDNELGNRAFGLIDWKLSHTTFSEFIFHMLSYRYTHYSKIHVSAEDEIPDDVTLTALRNRYTEGPITDLPEGKTYRFVNKGGIITIESRDSEKQGKARWTLRADSARSLLQLVESVRYFHTLEQSLGIKD